MPLVTFEPQNKIQSTVEFPRFKLDYQERALINCLDPQPTLQYVHVLNAPELDANGKILKEEKKNSKGESYEAPVYEFIGQHLCFGNFNTVADKGVDPDACPTCRAAVEEEGIQAPSPKYAMNIIRYATQPGGWTLRDPFSVSVEAWVFAPAKFNTLVDLAGDLPDKDLRKRDIRITCENKKFQKYDMHLTQGAAWLADDDRKKLVVETFQKNRCLDLDTLIARKIDKSKALEDIQKTIEKIQLAYGRGAAAAITPNVESKPAPVEDPWGTPLDTPADEAQANIPAPSVEKKSGGSMSFSDILNDL